MNTKPIDYFADLESDLDAGAESASVASTGRYLEDMKSHAEVGHGSRSKSAPAPLVPCSRCGGSGRYAGYGTCFKCGGSGKERGLRQDAASVKRREQAAAKRQQAAANEAADRQARIDAWRAEHPAQFAWLEQQAANPAGFSFEFALSLLKSLARFGSLTGGQLEAIDRALARKAEREATRAAQQQAAPSVAGAGFAKLHEAFAAALSHGLKYPKVRVAELVFSPAGANSKNPGCLYIKAGNGFDAPYLGKITADGHFLKGRDCTAEQAETIVRVGLDPLAEAVAHGKQTGRCACCGRELTDPESIERGIGPICAEQFGW